MKKNSKADDQEKKLAKINLGVILIVVVVVYNSVGCWCWFVFRFAASPSSDPGRGTGHCLVAHSSAVKAVHHEKEYDVINIYENVCKNLNVVNQKSQLHASRNSSLLGRANFRAKKAQHHVLKTAKDLCLPQESFV